MSLNPGTRLGPYEIVAPVGAGGMGEVYRARDTRLDRTVAIKVLASALAADAHFRERLEREARAISALNHPNICTLHDVGRHEGGTFLVMEFLEGETLAERLTRGALPLADALRIAIEIASALDKAHRHGIVHRDLKPGNIMLSRTGGGGPPVAKLLDFGLAKPGSASVSGAVPTALATASSITAQGTVLGTFQYMAPEQIEGDEADARSDIFAFGAVLFEMVTGRRAFQGRSQASLIGAILKDDPPPVSRVQPIAPPVLDYLVRTCLAKDRDARFQTAHDLLLQLKWIADGGSAAGVPAPVAVRRRRREWMAWTAAGLLAALWAGTLIWTWPFTRAQPAPASEIRFEVPVDDVVFPAWPAVSPNGEFLAYASRPHATSERMLTLRPMKSVTPQWIDGTGGAAQFFWSPNSRSVAFFADGKLKRVDVAGGALRTICDVPGGSTLPGGGAWSRDDVIILSTGDMLYRVPAAGGTPVELPRPEAGARAWRWPSFLPDGRRFLYLEWGDTAEDRAIFVGSLDDPRPRRLVGNTLNAQYTPPGYLVYQQQTTLLAQAFDADTLAVVGDPEVIAEDVPFNLTTGRGSFSVSEAGVLALRAGQSQMLDSELVWVDRSGRLAGTLGNPAPYRQIALSPDERSLAFSQFDRTAGMMVIWTVDLVSRVTSRLTYGSTPADDPIWGADNRTIAYFSLERGRPEFYQQAVGGRDVSTIFESGAIKYPHDWSRDGRFLLFHEGSSFYVLPMSGERTPRLLRAMKGAVDSGRFSPDGKWIAYGSDESGTWEIYVAPFPGFEYSRQVSSGGGVQPRWRGDSREIFFLSLDGRMMSVTVALPSDEKAEIRTTAPAMLFRASPISSPSAVIDQYVVTGDGKRFLFIRPPATGTIPITVVVNWQARLARR